MPRIILDFDPPMPNLRFDYDTSDLVYFLSWAFSARYGASHELSQAALLLRGEFQIDLTPLLTFADRDVEDPEDQAVLDRSWQEPGPLAECCDRVLEALDLENDQLSQVMEEYPGLKPAIAQLGEFAAAAAERGASIRVTYEMGEA